MKLFFDTETTGMALFKEDVKHIGQPYIVQLGALLTEDDGTERAVLDVIIKPDQWTVPEEVAKIHGLTTETCERCGVSIRAALTVFCHMMSKADTLIAHNIQFDQLVTGAAMFRAERSNAFDLLQQISKFCTMKFSTNICKLPGRYGYKWPTLTEAHQHFFQTPVEGAHDAMTDVRACKRIYFKMQTLSRQ